MKNWFCYIAVFCLACQSVFASPLKGEVNSFIPAAKLVGEQQYSIITDYLGTSAQAYNQAGELVWEYEHQPYASSPVSWLSPMGGLLYTEKDKNFIPFRYQGQYEDAETGLYYNRFRYYSPQEECYISQDPIGLAGNNPTLYGYVGDANGWVDVFGLSEHITFAIESLHPDAQGNYTIDATGYHHTDKVSLYEAAELKESFDSSKWISHHVDYDPETNKMRMQLVSLEAHKKKPYWWCK